MSLMSHWLYTQPTAIHFGCGIRKKLSAVCASFGTRPVLVTDRCLASSDMVQEVMSLLGSHCSIYADIDPNPTVVSVDGLAEHIGVHENDVVVALGGGSVLDCAKAAASLAGQGKHIRAYHSEGMSLDVRHLPLIAMPTTAGTGSEATPIAVLADEEKNIKAPLVHNNFFPAVAIVDPELTLTLPASVSAATGLDALSHAVEGYWSKGHQPICDLLALEASRLAFNHLPAVLKDGSDLAAREGMSLAALLAGMAFQLPKNAAVHACSYPISSQYHLPHGVACAMTLAWFIRFNASVMGDRAVRFARNAGFADPDAMADAIVELRRQAQLPIALSEVGGTPSDIPLLVENSFHPMINNNPRTVSKEDLNSMYMELLEDVG